MKIGILTFHRAENMGAVLQCRALYDYLKDKGHNVEIIDYRNLTIENSYSLFPRCRRNIIKYIISLAFTALKCKDIVKQKKKFSDFISQMQLTEPLTESDIMNEGLQYNLIISGSDQIWNPRLTNGFDKIYFLQFQGDFIRASYSASIGQTNNTYFFKNEFQKYLCNFDFISVREADAAEFIQERIRKPIYCTVDPTLLQPVTYWESMIDSVSMSLPEKYIFVYNVKQSCDLFKMASDLAKQLNIPIVHINFWRMPDVKFKSKTESVIDVGPLEFVYLIKNACKVVTSSFHGAAFSCIFQKDVYIYSSGDSGDPRLESLAHMYGLESRLVRSYEDFKNKQIAIENDVLYKNTVFLETLEISEEYLNKITNGD